MLGVLGVREGEAAELVCAGLRGATGVEVVSVSKVLDGVLSSGTPAIRKAISAVTHQCTRGQRPASQHAQGSELRPPLHTSAVPPRVRSAKPDRTQQGSPGDWFKADSSKPMQLCNQNTDLKSI